jgi:hypothetical protein
MKRKVKRYRWECGQHQEFGAWLESEGAARSAFWGEHTGRDCLMTEIAIYGAALSENQTKETE